MKSENCHTSTPQERPPVVMIVEDEPLAREAAARFLKTLGYCVTTAENGDSALTAGTKQPPDVLICDWFLGDGPDGVEVARILQHQQYLAVIFMTSHPLDELKAASHDLNVSGYFHKPLSLPALANAVKTAVSSKHLR